jgi:hypothetical protein
VERKIIFGKWQCRKCGFYLSQDLNYCPICEIRKKENKKRGILIRSLKKLLYILPKRSQRYGTNWQNVIKMRFGIFPFKKMYKMSEIAEKEKISKQAIHLVLSKARDTIAEIEGRD